MQLLSTLNSLDNVADGSTRKLLKTATSSGSGNAVTAVSISGDKLTYTKGATFLETSDVSVSQTLTSGTEIGEITIDGSTTKLYAPSTGSVNTSLASPQQTYYLTGVQTTAAGQGNLYNSYLSSTYTGIKYVTSTSQEGGSLYVDDREVVTGLYYEIS